METSFTWELSLKVLFFLVHQCFEAGIKLLSPGLNVKG